MSASCCSSSSECADAAPPAPAKFHASLNVTDLARSVEFYRLLLGCAPAKSRHDYAKFELSEPPLVLSLIPSRTSAGDGGGGGVINHFGLRVADAETLVETQRRLELGSVRTQREDGVECCYSRQTKFWVADPDRALWEIYILHDEIDEHGDGEVPRAESLVSGEPTSPAPERVIWRHRIGEPIPSRLPHQDNSVHEAALEGSANLESSPDFLPALLAEVFRALRPGGTISLRGLTADRPLTEPLPPLPGPAAVVERVPAHGELPAPLEAAGFHSVFFETLSATAHFTVGGVSLRESLVTARKPGHRPSAASRTAIYLGPLASVTDDFGNTFRRGVPAPLNIHDFLALSRSPAAGAFLFPEPWPVTSTAHRAGNPRGGSSPRPARPSG